MNWRNELRFQREQFAAMLPTRSDWELLGFSVVFTAVALGLYAAISGVVLLVLTLISGV